MTSHFSKFTTPAQQGPKDFSDLGLEKELPLFEAAWNTNVTGWSAMSIIGNPWSNLYDAPRTGYYNPIETGFGTDGDAVVSWTPFPNRLIAFLTQQGASSNPQLGRPLTEDEVFALADSNQIKINGKTLVLYDPKDGEELIQIPEQRCPEIDWTGRYGGFSPYGPRGWLDEYCEWAITRDAHGRMTSVMFTCENPAYYLTMWRVDPEAVLGIYRKYVDPAVQLEDLYLRYAADTPSGKKGDPVVDPTTGRPAYDPTSKWNSGTVRVPGQYGGAIHLTSPPNTLSAEIYLAAAATIPRASDVSGNAQTLICCAKYGQNYRNSDPHIGFSANRASYAGQLSLTDPVGLYIQQPQDFSNWKGPQGQDVQQYWHVTRGTAGTGPEGSDQILHVVFEIPESEGFTINDCTINGQPIDHVGVIANTMKIALSVTLMKPPGPSAPQNCVTERTGGIQPWPVQFLPESLFYGLSVSDLPALLLPGTTNSFVLVVQGAAKDTTAENARIQFSNDAVTATVTKYLPDASAIPGQTDGGGTQGYIMDVTVGAGATPGPVLIRALNPDEGADPSADDHPWEAGLAVIPG
jgi:hypothetical protein